jgi:ribonuclease HI
LAFCPPFDKICSTIIAKNLKKEKFYLKMKKVTIFTDGACLGNPGAGGWCAILRYKGHEKILRGNEANTTNNRMELKAVIEALRALKEPCKVDIYSDSTYVVNGINEWLNGWVKRNFKKVKNKDLWMEYLEVSKPHMVTLHWIKAHNNHKENEICDKIAKEEAKNVNN